MLGAIDFVVDQIGIKPNTHASSGVEFVRRDLIEYLDQYDLIDDCIAGEQRIKTRRQKYLPMPGEPSKSWGSQKDNYEAYENAAQAYRSRYQNYVGRAVFYNVAGRTLEAFTGAVFTRDATVELPGVLKFMEDDANGEGVSLDQLAQKAVSIVISKGRAGCFIDYPAVAEATSQADLSSGKIKPSIHVFHPKQVINWKTERVNGRTAFTLVVIQDTEIDPTDADEFANKPTLFYRELRLIEGVYHYREWRKQKDGKFTHDGFRQPLNYQGKPYDELPFRFIGPRESSSRIEKPPLYDLCSLNVAHYRNSADYEESCYTTGQPTVWASGLDTRWVADVLGGVVDIGARGFLPLPVNASCGIMQTEPNSQPFEAMEHKERQMVSLGAKVVEQKQVQRTATEASQEEAAEASVLSSTARNVSKCLLWALQWSGYFVGVDEGTIKYELNTDFDLANLDAALRQILLNEYQGGAITFTELRENLRKAGIATLDDEKARAEIKKERVELAAETEFDPDNEPPAEDE